MIQESIEDFRKRYRDTFLFLEIKNKKHLVKYIEDDHENFIFFSSEHGNLLVKEETARTCLSFYFPETGLYNCNNALYFFSRYPARQWRRAPCKENTNLQKINLSFHEPSQGLKQDIANQIFFPKYPKSTKEALDNFKNSIAINKTFGVVPGVNKYKETPILLYNNTPVGIIDNKNNNIVVKHKALLQEVKDYYYAKEPEWKISE